ncbi:hypothetical protein RLIN73S_05419 [Rhodanobacter lindaniclasticus]
MVRAAGDVPVAEGGAFDPAALAVRAQHGIGVVADVVAVDAAEECGDLAVRRACQRDAAAFAALVDELAFGHEAGAAVVRPAVVDRGAEVRLAGGVGGDQVALVDPGDHDAAGAVHRQRVEAVGDLGAVVVHGQRRAEVLAAVQRAGEAHEAGPRRGARLRPAHIDLVVRPESEFRTVLALGVDALGGGVHLDRRAQRAAVVIGMAQSHMAVRRIHDVQPALAVERRAGAQLGAFGHVHVHAVVSECGQRQQAEHGDQQVAHHSSQRSSPNQVRPA